MDLIQFYNLLKSCEPVVKHMRKEVDDQKRKQKEYDMFEDEMTKFRRELEKRDKEQKDKQGKVDPLQKARE